MTIMGTLTYQHRQPDNWLYEIKQKGDSKTCYVMVQNAKVCIALSPRLRKKNISYQIQFSIYNQKQDT